MKKLFLILTTALFAAGFASCTDDPEETVNPVVVSEILRALGGNVLVNVPEENFDVNIPADAASWVQINEAESSGKALVLSVDENETGTERSTVVNVTRSGKSTVLATVTIKQSDITLQAGEFVIEEIYFTGTALPETGKPDRWLGDQYIKIRNNSDEDLYADGMMLILSSGLNSGMNSEMIEGKDFRKECCAGNAFYCIPGNGQDVLVKAGESLIVVNNAQNHTIGNPNSWDATKADFEWYDVSSNENYLDIDNPDVPNLDKWYASTLTVQVLHNRGFKAYGIARIPVDKEEYLRDYLYDYEYVMTLPAGTFPMSESAYRLANEWIVDVVNCSIASDFAWVVSDSSLDSGWTHCGEINADKNRFFKSVRRKLAGFDRNGIAILQDTNNSSEDFNADCVPSEIERQGTAIDAAGTKASSITYDGVTPVK